MGHHFTDTGDSTGDQLWGKSTVDLPAYVTVAARPRSGVQGAGEQRQEVLLSHLFWSVVLRVGSESSA